jgi:hypothetical protein
MISTKNGIEVLGAIGKSGSYKIKIGEEDFNMSSTGSVQDYYTQDDRTVGLLSLTNKQIQDVSRIHASLSKEVGNLLANDHPVYTVLK